jgi:esterase
MTVKLQYQTYGHGEPVFILHGLFGSGRNWSSISRQLANDYSVFTIDLRNHGASGHADSMRYTEMAKDIVELARQLGVKNVGLIGHSMGGKTAMVASLLYPEFVNKLIVIDIAPVNYPSNHDELISAMLALPVEQIENRTQADEYLAANIQEPVLRQFLLQNLLKDGDRYKWRINLDAIRNNHTLLRQFPDEVRTLTYEKLTLFLSGALSDYIKPEHDEAISTYFPQHEHVVVDNANHWVHADKPKSVIEEVSRFLVRN